MLLKLIIRSVNHAREITEVKPLYHQFYPEAQTRFPYTRKVILAFYDLGASDAIFLGFVVHSWCNLILPRIIIHECGDDCDEPNFKVLKFYLWLLFTSSSEGVYITPRLSQATQGLTSLKRPYKHLSYHSSRLLALYCAAWIFDCPYFYMPTTTRTKLHFSLQARCATRNKRDTS